MRIIVALDILNGKCVRLIKGDYNKVKVYNENPLEVAKEIECNGIEYLHLVDLDGAKNKKTVNYKILEKISGKTRLKIDFGGGVRSLEDLQAAFNCGASQVTLGSIAVLDPQLFLKWLAEFGQEKIILGADVRKRKVSTSGWTEGSDKEIMSFIADYRAKGVKYTICTDIDKDGMLRGPSTGLYKEILKIPGIKLISSGGISSVEDIEEMDKIGCEGTIIGKAIYEGKLTLKDLSRLC
ncbi:MAG: 1-(5-phosphoribosyl)-5-[(5-phosphoribosylamino)methylideneamino]imidazole-4-carboxamide isomerase [Bacteroidales bacterium]|nr:1-(5-phosphoribosyl)-5-[(5-phosphoribosylamino)methylideneamino]imidazole-4-carboxamide isomerase [Bacteroidales bacterium]